MRNTKWMVHQIHLKVIQCVKKLLTNAIFLALRSFSPEVRSSRLIPSAGSERKTRLRRKRSWPWAGRWEKPSTWFTNITGMIWWFFEGFRGKLDRKLWFYQQVREIHRDSFHLFRSVVSPTAATLYSYKSFWSVLRSQALETPQLSFRELDGRKSCWTWPGSAPKPSTPSPEPSPDCWTWPGSAPTPPGTFSGTLLNLTWLCTKASQTFSGTFSGTFSWTFSGTLLNLTWPCTEASQTLTGTFSGTSLNLTWLCTEASQTFSGTFGTFSGTSLNLTRRLHQCTPELFWAEDPISLRCWGKIWETSLPFRFKPHRDDRAPIWFNPGDAHIKWKAAEPSAWLYTCTIY